MPHAVLRGAFDLAALHAGWSPIDLRTDDGVRRTDEVFLNARGDKLLIEAVVVERGRTQRFYVVIAARAGGATVRIDAATDPEKTRGVQELVAEVARRLLDGGAEIERTNLGAWLDAPAAADPDAR